MKKILIIIAVSLVILGLALFLFINSMQSEVEGVWKSTSEEDNCFSRVSFTDGPAETRGIIIDETNGNHKQVWFGIHKVKGKKLSVELSNPKADPFEMIYKKSGDQLQLDYTWENEEHSCTYENLE